MTPPTIRKPVRLAEYLTQEGLETRPAGNDYNLRTTLRAERERHQETHALLLKYTACAAALEALPGFIQRYGFRRAGLS